LSLGRAFQVLTRLPVAVTGEPEADWLARAAKWFPVVGVAVGVLSGGVFWLSRMVWPSGAIPALLAITAAALITGGLHEDGLADVADGFGAGRDVDSRLRIMKDSHIGTYGVLALLLATAGKIAALNELTAWQGFAALVAAHGAGRAGCSLTMRALAYVRPTETSKFPGMGRPTAGETTIAAVIGLTAFALLPWQAALAAMAAAVAAFLVLGWLAHRKLDGYTGDVLGAVEQAIEIAVLLAASAILGRL
jgi:adenosylcobinamide-GDP ribazoletransferase